MSENNPSENTAAANDLFSAIPDNGENDQELNATEIPESVLSEASAGNPAPEGTEAPAEGTAEESADGTIDPLGDAEALEDAQHKNSLLAKAAELRAQAAMEPMLLGKDADLLTYNAQTQQFEPVNDEAKRMLLALGEAADIHTANPLSGSNMTTPLRYHAEKGVIRNAAASPVKVASNLDSKNRMQVSYENKNSRFDRAVDALAERTRDQESGEKTHHKAVGSTENSDEDASASQSPEANEGEGETASNERGTDPLAPSASEAQPGGGPHSPLAAAAASLAAGTLTLTARVIEVSEKLLAEGAAVTASIYNRVKAHIVSNVQGLTTQEGSRADLGDAANDALSPWTESAESRAALRPANDADLAGDPITPDAETNATATAGLSGISDKIRQFQSTNEAPTLEEAGRIRSEYTGSIKDGLNQVESALKLNEVGQIPIVSQQDFENRLKTATPEERERAEAGINTILAASQRYQSDTQSFLMGNGSSRPVDKLSPETAEAQVRAFDALAASPDKDLDDHQKKLLDQISLSGAPLGERIGSLFESFRNMMQSVSARLTALGAAQSTAGAVAQQVNAGNHEQVDAVRQG